MHLGCKAKWTNLAGSGSQPIWPVRHASPKALFRASWAGRVGWGAKLSRQLRRHSNCQIQSSYIERVSRIKTRMTQRKIWTQLCLTLCRRLPVNPKACRQRWWQWQRRWLRVLIGGRVDYLRMLVEVLRGRTRVEIMAVRAAAFALIYPRRRYWTITRIGPVKIIGGIGPID